MHDPLAIQHADRPISDQELNRLLDAFIEQKAAKAKRVLLIPPDITRYYSQAGHISRYLYQQLSPRAVVYLLPALGTHDPMTEAQRLRMFGPDIPADRFLRHDWRRDIKPYGEIPSQRIAELSEGKLSYSMQVAVNRALEEGQFDLIVSIGQVVPHEVIGMANYTKNILIGVGGPDTINKSHFLGAVYGMERIMGRANSPVRQALNEGFRQHLSHLPIEFILTVVGKIDGQNALQGVYCGNDDAPYQAACQLSQKLNIDALDRPIRKAIVFLEPDEFHSTWIGNKAVYRTRMAMADDGELIILAPGLTTCGEDREIDRLIRKYGYRTTPETLQAVEANEELKENLSAAAHLIHGSSEGRFKITYCPGSGLSKETVESVGYAYADLQEIQKRYQTHSLRDGWNTTADGEEIFYVSNPALGLWSHGAQEFE